MNVVDQYPSTADLPRRIAGGQDLVLAILQGARKRYLRGGTNTAYIAGRYVCAVGAIAREAGIDSRQYAGISLSHGGGLSLGVDFDEVLKAADLETAMRTAAKQAIRLLNRSATRLYPQSADAGRWSGPLEWVNQAYPDDWKQVKKAVLNCYNDAIQRRQASVARATA